MEVTRRAHNADNLKYNVLLKATGEDHKTTISRQVLLEMLHISKQDKEFKHVSYVQKEIPGKNKHLVTTHFRFRLSPEKEQSQNFARAEIESLVLAGKIPVVSSNYRSFEQECDTMLSLMRNDRSEYYDYVNCKIFHHLKVFHSLLLTNFISEFTTDSNMNVMLSDVNIFSMDDYNKTAKHKSTKDSIMEMLDEISLGISSSYRNSRDASLQKIDRKSTSVERKAGWEGVTRKKRFGERVVYDVERLPFEVSRINSSHVYYH